MSNDWLGNLCVLRHGVLIFRSYRFPLKESYAGLSKAARTICCARPPSASESEAAGPDEF